MLGFQKIIKGHWLTCSLPRILYHVLVRENDSIRVAQMNFAIPTILVGITYSYLPYRDSYLPNNFVCHHVSCAPYKKRDFGHTIIRCGRLMAQFLAKSCALKRFRTVNVGDFDAPTVNINGN